MDILSGCCRAYTKDKGKFGQKESRIDPAYLYFILFKGKDNFSIRMGVQ
jgi:hypothetical protein